LVSRSNIHLTTEQIEGQQLGDFLAVIAEFQKEANGLG